MKKRLIIVSICLIALGGVISYLVLNKPVESQVNTNSTVEQPKPVETYTKPTQEELFKLTNEERMKAGAKPLTLDDRLNMSASVKAKELSTTPRDEYNNNFHVNPAGVEGYTLILQYAPDCDYTSENLAIDYTGDVISGLMTSDAHRNAILDNRYELVGFGVSSDFVVQHFCDIGQ